MRCARLVVWLFLIGAISSISADPVQWEVSDGGNGHYYEYVRSPLRWAEARDASKGRIHEGIRGYLANIASSAENDFIMSIIPPDVKDVWIGLHFESDAGWVWADGPESGTALSNYAPWRVGEPTRGDQEDIVGLAGPAHERRGRWADYSSRDGAPYIVEYSELDLPGPEEPSVGRQFITGGLLLETWLRLPGSSLNNLTNHTRFLEPPDRMELARELEIPRSGIGDGDDNYGARLSGYLRVPFDGEYLFRLSSDDEGALFLSTDSNPENRRLVALVNEWTRFREWNRGDDETRNPRRGSEPIQLSAGHWYYVEALLKEGGRGSDHLSVTWQTPRSGPVTRESQPIPGSFLGALVDPAWELPTPPEEPDPHFWSTVAGRPGLSGYRDRSAAESLFSEPAALAVDAEGRLVIADMGNHVIRRLNPDGRVVTLAGEPRRSGARDGMGGEAGFNSPEGIAPLPDGSVLVADTMNHAIRRVTPEGVVTTWAGRLGGEGSGDGMRLEATFSRPVGIAVDATETVYVSDFWGNLIRKISPDGIVETIGGFPNRHGTSDGPATESRFYHPRGLAIDLSGDVIVADSSNHLIRRVTPGGLTSTVAGLPEKSGSADGLGVSAGFHRPFGVTVTEHGIYVADFNNRLVRRIDADGLVSTVGGARGRSGAVDGVGAEALFVNPQEITSDNAGTLYVADTRHHVIRMGVRMENLVDPVIPPLRIVTDLIPQEVSYGSDATLSVDASGYPPYTYQWFRGSELVGETDDPHFVAKSMTSLAGEVYFVRVSDQLGRSILSSKVEITALPPDPVEITSQPQDLMLFAGETGTLVIEVDGAGPIEYQWFFNGQIIPGATGDRLALEAVTTEQQGNYLARVTNPSRQFVVSRLVSVSVALPPPPVIELQPEDIAVRLGDSATFRVAAVGAGPFSYQWFFEGEELAAGSAAELSVSVVEEGNIGSYYVVIRDVAGQSVRSDTVQLSLAKPEPPEIVQQPVDLRAGIGEAIEFKVEVTGERPLEYQWFFDDRTIAGETTPLLRIESVQESHFGRYWVSIKSEGEIVVSREATLRPVVTNDHFANREKIDGIEVSLTQSNDGATREAQEPLHGGFGAGGSVWWSWRPVSSGVVTISTMGSSIDTLLAVYTGPTLEELNEVGFNDDSPTGGTFSELTWNAQRDEEYQIVVDSFGEQQGAIVLELRLEIPPPQLRIELSGRNIVLSWPDGHEDLILEMSPSLSPERWETADGGEPQRVGDRRLVKLPIGEIESYFRLRQTD